MGHEIKICGLLLGVAAFLISAAFLASLAFNSITFQSISEAMALAMVVFPTPGVQLALFPSSLECHFPNPLANF